MGSTIGLLTQDGRLSARYYYDEFGMVLDSKKFDVNWPGPDNLYGYTGLEYDYYTDLNYARARYYKPEIGRFISEDTYKGTMWNPQSQNLYTYVHNNPLTYIDPTGNWCESADGKHSFPGSCGNTKGTVSNDAESDGKWITFNGHKMEQYYYDTSNDSVSDLPWYEEILLGTVTGGVGGAVSRVIKKGFDDVVTSAGKYFAKGTGKDLLNVGSKADALKSINNLPTNIQSSVKSFFKGGSNKYNSFEVIQSSNGNYIAKMTKPGDVLGSKAVYYKEIAPDGKTIRVYKETFDPSGNLVHLKDK